MNKRFISRVVAGTLAATALLIGSLSAPAQAAKPDNSGFTSTSLKGDTGWGP